MDRYVTVEEHSGTGNIRQDGQIVISDIDYVFRITQRMIDASTLSGRREVPGMKSIDGWLHVTPGNHELFTLVGEPIELELRDGRRWLCFIQSSDGTMVNRGGLKEPE